jgi:hypothetical protein
MKGQLIAANVQGLLPWRTSNLMNVPGGAALTFYIKRRVAPQSHGSKPMLAAGLFVLAQFSSR